MCLPEIKESLRLFNLKLHGYDFFDPPQYIVVLPTDSKMKDMICISQEISNNQNINSD